MDFDFSEEQELLRRSVREFLEREAPREKVRLWDDEGQYPAELYDKMAAVGYFGLPFPEEYGGAGCGAIEFAILGEELARSSYDIAAGYGLTVFMAMNLLHHGTKEQKDYYLPRVVKGEQRFSVSITEPGAGSDAASVTTFAQADGDDYLINGQKMFSTAAGQPKNVIHLVARTDRNVPKHKGLTFFLVDPKTPGMEIRPLRTLGRRILTTNAIYIENVRVPRQNIIGQLNGGWKVMLSGLELERLFTSSAYVGNAQTVVDDAVRYAKEREQFGQPIGKFQAIAHMLADMQTDVDAARLLTYRAAFLIAKGRPALKEVSMAKLFGSEALVRATNNGMQILGGFGYIMETDMQRYFRDARIVTVSAGSSQVQRNIIARAIGL